MGKGNSLKKLKKAIKRLKDDVDQLQAPAKQYRLNAEKGGQFRLKQEAIITEEMRKIYRLHELYKKAKENYDRIKANPALQSLEKADKEKAREIDNILSAYAEAATNYGIDQLAAKLDPQLNAPENTLAIPEANPQQTSPKQGKVKVKDSLTAKEMAYELFIQSAKIISALPNDALNVNYKEPELKASLQAYTDFCKELTNTVIIDLLSSSTGKIGKKAHYWLIVMEEAIKEQNYTTASAIYNALNHSFLQKYKEQYKSDKKYTDAETLFLPANNLAAYRNALREQLNNNSKLVLPALTAWSKDILAGGGNDKTEAAIQIKTYFKKPSPQMDFMEKLINSKEAANTLDLTSNNAIAQLINNESFFEAYLTHAQTEIRKHKDQNLNYSYFFNLQKVNQFLPHYLEQRLDYAKQLSDGLNTTQNQLEAKIAAVKNTLVKINPASDAAKKLNGYLLQLETLHPQQIQCAQLLAKEMHAINELKNGLISNKIYTQADMLLMLAEVNKLNEALIQRNALPEIPISPFADLTKVIQDNPIAALSPVDKSNEATILENMMDTVPPPVSPPPPPPPIDETTIFSTNSTVDMTATVEPPSNPLPPAPDDKSRAAQGENITKEELTEIDSKLVLQIAGIENSFFSGKVNRNVAATAYSEKVSLVSSEIRAVNKHLLSKLTDLDNIDDKNPPPSHVEMGKASDGLKNYVLENILMPDNPAKALLRIEFWSAVMKNCLEKGDYQATFTILAALNDDLIKTLMAKNPSLLSSARKITAEVNELFASLENLHKLILSHSNKDGVVIPLLSEFKKILIMDKEKGGNAYKVNATTSLLQKYITDANKPPHLQPEEMSSLQQSIMRDYQVSDTVLNNKANYLLTLKMPEKTINKIFNKKGNIILADEAHLKLDKSLEEYRKLFATIKKLESNALDLLFKNKETKPFSQTLASLKQNHEKLNFINDTLKTSKNLNNKLKIALREYKKALTDINQIERKFSPGMAINEFTSTLDAKQLHDEITSIPKQQSKHTIKDGIKITRLSDNNVFLAELPTGDGNFVAVTVKILESSATHDKFIASGDKNAAKIYKHLAQQFYNNKIDGINPGVYLEISEYCKGASLNKENIKNIEQKREKAVINLKGMVKIIKDLNSANIYHPDIKLSNFLTRENGSFVISDTKNFYKSKDENAIVPNKHIYFTDKYLPKELLNAKDINLKQAQTYLLGMALYEYMTGKAPEKDAQGNHLFHFDTTNIQAAFSGILGSNLKSLIIGLTSNNINEQLSLEQLDNILSSPKLQTEKLPELSIYQTPNNLDTNKPTTNNAAQANSTATNASVKTPLDKEDVLKRDNIPENNADNSAINDNALFLIHTKDLFELLNEISIEKIKGYDEITKSTSEITRDVKEIRSFIAKLAKERENNKFTEYAKDKIKAQPEEIIKKLDLLLKSKAVLWEASIDYGDLNLTQISEEVNSIIASKNEPAKEPQSKSKRKAAYKNKPQPDELPPQPDDFTLLDKKAPAEYSHSPQGLLDFLLANKNNSEILAPDTEKKPNSLRQQFIVLASTLFKLDDKHNSIIKNNIEFKAVPKLFERLNELISNEQIQADLVISHQINLKHPSTAKSYKEFISNGMKANKTLNSSHAAFIPATPKAIQGQVRLRAASIAVYKKLAEKRKTQLPTQLQQFTQALSAHTLDNEAISLKPIEDLTNDQVAQLAPDKKAELIGDAIQRLLNENVDDKTLNDEIAKLNEEKMHSLLERFDNIAIETNKEIDPTLKQLLGEYNITIDNILDASIDNIEIASEMNADDLLAGLSSPIVPVSDDELFNSTDFDRLMNTEQQAKSSITGSAVNKSAKNIKSDIGEQLPEGEMDPLNNKSHLSENNYLKSDMPANKNTFNDFYFFIKVNPTSRILLRNPTLIERFAELASNFFEEKSGNHIINTTMKWKGNLATLNCFNELMSHETIRNEFAKLNIDLNNPITKASLEHFIEREKSEFEFIDQIGNTHTIPPINKNSNLDVHDIAMNNQANNPIKAQDNIPSLDEMEQIQAEAASNPFVTEAIKNGTDNTNDINADVELSNMSDEHDKMAHFPEELADLINEDYIENLTSSDDEVDASNLANSSSKLNVGNAPNSAPQINVKSESPSITPTSSSSQAANMHAAQRPNNPAPDKLPTTVTILLAAPTLREAPNISKPNPLATVNALINKHEKNKYPESQFTYETKLANLNGKQTHVVHVIKNEGSLTDHDRQKINNESAKVRKLALIASILNMMDYSDEFLPSERRDQFKGMLVNLAKNTSNEINGTKPIRENVDEFVNMVVSQCQNYCELPKDDILKHIRNSECYYVAEKNQQRALVFEHTNARNERIIEIDAPLDKKLSTEQKQALLAIHQADEASPLWFNRLFDFEQAWFKDMVPTRINGDWSKFENLFLTSNMQHIPGLKNGRINYLLLDKNGKQELLSTNIKNGTLSPYAMPENEKQAASEHNAKKMLDILQREARDSRNVKWGSLVDSLPLPILFQSLLSNTIVHRFDSQLSDQFQRAVKAASPNDGSVEVFCGTEAVNLLRRGSPQTKTRWDYASSILNYSDRFFEEIKGASLSPQQQHLVQLIDKARQALRELKSPSLIERIKRNFSSENLEAFKVSYLTILVESMGGMVSTSCKSGKDRTGIQEIYNHAMRIYFEENGELPKLNDNKNNQEKFSTIVSELFNTMKSAEAASMNSPGAFGINERGKVLNGNIANKIGTTYGDSIVRAVLNKPKSFKGGEQYVNKAATKRKLDINPSANTAAPAPANAKAVPTAESTVNSSAVASTDMISVIESQRDSLVKLMINAMQVRSDCVKAAEVFNINNPYADRLATEISQKVQAAHRVTAEVKNAFEMHANLQFVAFNNLKQQAYNAIDNGDRNKRNEIAAQLEALAKTFPNTHSLNLRNSLYESICAIVGALKNDDQGVVNHFKSLVFEFDNIKIDSLIKNAFDTYYQEQHLNKIAEIIEHQGLNKLSIEDKHFKVDTAIINKTSNVSTVSSASKMDEGGVGGFFKKLFNFNKTEKNDPAVYMSSPAAETHASTSKIIATTGDKKDSPTSSLDTSSVTSAANADENTSLLSKNKVESPNISPPSSALGSPINMAPRAKNKAEKTSASSAPLNLSGDVFNQLYEMLESAAEKAEKLNTRIQELIDRHPEKNSHSPGMKSKN